MELELLAEARLELRLGLAFEHLIGGLGLVATFPTFHTKQQKTADCKKSTRKLSAARIFVGLKHTHTHMHILYINTSDYCPALRGLELLTSITFLSNR